MHGQNNQQAYDRGITTFSPDGRLYQVEYAREAVKRGTPSVGVRTDDGVVLAADRRARSPLIERDSIEKLHAVDDHVGVATAGHVADGRTLVDVARRQAQLNRVRYDEPIGVEALTKALTDHVQEYTQTGGARPFGVALLVGGVDEGAARLFETDPSGTPYEWRAVGVGGDRREIQAHLEETYHPATDLEAGVELAMTALGRVADEGLDPAGVDVATVDVESGRFERLDDDEVTARVTEFDLGGERDG